MYSYIITFFALCVVVNANLIQLNVFDDDSLDDNTVVDYCNIQACDQLCRRIGFTGGVCLNGRCKCDIKRIPVADTEETEEDEVRSAVESETSPRACIYQQCNQTCLRLGFKRGACVNNVCRCYA